MENPYQFVTDYQHSSLTPAKQAVRQAYVVLSRQSGYDALSVKELCHKAHVSRSTFYAYYENTGQVLEEIENDIICELVRLNPDLASPSENDKDHPYFYRTKQYIEEHRNILSLLLNERPEYRFVEKLKNAIKYHFWQRAFQNRNTEDDKLILELIASVIVSAYSYWIKNPYSMNEQYMVRVISSVLSLIDKNSQP